MTRRSSEQNGIRQLEGIGLLWRLALFGPLEKRPSRYEAAPLVKGLAPGRSLGDRLRTSVDGRETLDVLEILREERDQTQRARMNSRSPLSRLCRVIGCCVLGATL